MSFNATINGVQVRSDKDATSIINSRVEFADGSWCDVATGQVVNCGPGEISIGQPNAASDKIVTRDPEQFSAARLHLRQLLVDVLVEPHQADHIEVTLSGTEAELATVRTSLQGDTLVIEDDADAGKSSLRMVTRGGRKHFVARNISLGRIRQSSSIILTDSGIVGESEAKATVKVPAGTPISVTSSFGNTRIGNIEGPLSVHVMGSGKVEAGRMADVNLHVQGSGDVRVAEVTGKAALNVQGSGDITVSGGTIDSLAASVTGSGDVTVGGTVRRADLRVVGSGDIQVAHVLERPAKSVVGSGDITVGRIG